MSNATKTVGWVERDEARFASVPQEIEYRVPLSDLARAHTGRDSIIVILQDHGEFDTIKVVDSALSPLVQEDYPEWDWVLPVDERLAVQLDKTDWYANAHCPGNPGHSLSWDPEAKIYRLKGEMTGDPEIHEVPIYRSASTYKIEEAEAIAASVPHAIVWDNGPFGHRQYWAQVDKSRLDSCPEGWQESWQCEACLNVGLHNLGCWVEQELEDRAD